jgi:DNA-binding MarR family transcriptional regulator
MDVSASAGLSPMKPSDPEALPSALRLAVMRLARRLRQQSVGQVTASQHSALATVGARGPLSLGEMAAIEQIAPPSMTRIAARLEEMGLVQRQVDSADRRVARLAITAAGAHLLEETRTRRDLYLARCLQRFTAEERAALAAALPLLERLASDD